MNVSTQLTKDCWGSEEKRNRVPTAPTFCGTILVPAAGVEPATFRSGGERSNPLSYAGLNKIAGFKEMNHECPLFVTLFAPLVKYQAVRGFQWRASSHDQKLIRLLSSKYGTGQLLCPPALLSLAARKLSLCFIAAQKFFTSQL